MLSTKNEDLVLVVKTLLALLDEQYENKDGEQTNLVHIRCANNETTYAMIELCNTLEQLVADA